ncbi:glycerate kinase [Nothoprocta perdicaria]|uniref:glycerate kinase n=1 Tax=Nothoprocta perdicaria TaxID=30464 RepID=UPI000E1C0D7F|nr:glycerate kinase [Nothoprocta perdicaria]
MSLAEQGRAVPLAGRLCLAAFGKAALGMAAAAEDILGERLERGVVSAPAGGQESLRRAGMRDMLLKPGSRIEVMEGARDNRPDAAALRAAGAIRALAEGLGADDVLLVLISGGGSALLPAPTPPVLLEEKEALTRLLAARGAAIQELNAVRKALSVLKGGGLARLAHPARVVSLILSDVIGDPVDVIASGPTAASAHGAQDCLRILAKYDLLRGLPASVQAVLGSAEPAAPHDYSHVANVVVGSNALALAEAKPTEAAGAVCGAGLAEEARGEGLDPHAFLGNNDSYSFFRRLRHGRHLLVTGLTGTNVMDIHVVLVRAKERS